MLSSGMHNDGFMAKNVFNQAAARLRKALRPVFESVVGINKPKIRMKYMGLAIAAMPRQAPDDDKGEFSAEGGMEATTALCDRSATSGAVLVDADWTSEREMETALLEYTKKSWRAQSSTPHPGWVSVAGALGFQRGQVVVCKGPLSAFLESAGVNF